MRDIDKSAFGAFVASERKALGMTQKDLAGMLCVSDKAVSKWERGLSLPDITLLEPLAEALNVSVVELLECRRLEKEPLKEETLVKKVISFSEEPSERIRARKAKNALTIGLCTLSAVAVNLLSWTFKIDLRRGLEFMGTLEILSVIFGIYFWCFMKERLPNYYDENRVNAYSDGFFRMNMQGVSFNNSNWLYIVKACRVWSATATVGSAIVWSVVSALKLTAGAEHAVFMTLLILFLGGLFVPIYIVGKKYS